MSGCLANSYRQKFIVVEDVSKPAKKKINTCAASSFILASVFDLQKQVQEIVALHIVPLPILDRFAHQIHEERFHIGVGNFERKLARNLSPHQHQNDLDHGGHLLLEHFVAVLEKVRVRVAQRIALDAERARPDHIGRVAGQHVLHLHLSGVRGHVLAQPLGHLQHRGKHLLHLAGREGGRELLAQDLPRLALQREQRAGQWIYLGIAEQTPVVKDVEIFDEYRFDELRIDRHYRRYIPLPAARTSERGLNVTFSGVRSTSSVKRNDRTIATKPTFTSISPKVSPIQCRGPSPNGIKGARFFDAPDSLDPAANRSGLYTSG
uniref:Uncharacterized protein n=1 Tax=Anopheles coluzzii TaxID=1518534 RepID=A0A8W7PTH8_ANOCL